MNFTRCFQLSFWTTLCGSSEESAISSVERLQAKIAAQKMKIEDYQNELVRFDAQIREHIRCKDMTSAKSTLRKKKGVALQLGKTEHQLGVNEALLANVDEVSDVRDTAEIVVALQREFKHVNVDKLYTQVARATDALTSQRELVAETNQALAGHASDVNFAVDDAALEAELQAMLEDQVDVRVGAPSYSAPPSMLPPVAQPASNPLETLYSRFLIES